MSLTREQILEMPSDAEQIRLLQRNDSWAKTVRAARIEASTLVVAAEGRGKGKGE